MPPSVPSLPECLRAVREDVVNSCLWPQRKIIVSVLSQLGGLASHKPNLGVCKHDTLELSLQQYGGVQFF